MNKTSILLVVLTSSLIFFAVGYKVGGNIGYNEGYDIGYRYDCKEEISAIYKQVKSQSKALEYTDSAIRRVHRVNDSLMHKEYYQRQAEKRIQMAREDSLNKVKYSSYAKRYNDSIARKVGEKYPTNFILEDGRVNVLWCGSEPYSGLKECECWRKSEKKKDAVQYFSAIAECENYVRERFDSRARNRRKGRK